MMQKPPIQLHWSVTEFVVMKLYGGLSICQMKPTQGNGTGKVPVINPQAVMKYREMKLSFHVLLTLTIHEGEWSASYFGCFSIR